MRTLLITAFAALVACNGGAGDARTEEVWSIDFQTYGDEVDLTIRNLGLDRALVEQRTLEYVEFFFDGLPIRFEIGVSAGSALQSSICVRNGSDTRYGRGVLDMGNDNVVHDCGEPDGTEHGAFINRIGESYASQMRDTTYAEQQRVDLFARLLAMVLAHEIGHGLGLPHSDDDYGYGDIMKATPNFAIGTYYYFSEDARALLANNLLFGSGTQ